MVDYTVPLNYVNQAFGQTPDQVKSTYDYAKALMQGSGQQPIKHWTQGVSNIVNALVGGDLDFRTAQAQRVALERAKADQQSTVPAQNFPAVEPSGPASGPLKSPPFPAPLPSGGDNSEMDRSKSATSSIESGGKYDAIGPVTKTGDHAYGKYQIMGNNIPEWSEAALGKRMTPEEFIKNEAAQEAIYEHKFGEYTKKYGPVGASKAWFAGEKGMNNPQAADINGMTVERYGQKFANAFAGPDDVSKVPAVAAMSSALRGGPSDAGDPGVQVAAGKAVPASVPQVTPVPSGTPLQRPDPSGTAAPGIDPQLIKPQPGFTQERLRSYLANPFVSEEDKRAAYQMMLQRGQPVEMRSPTGVGTYLVDPNNSKVQQYMAPAPHWGTEKISDTGIERPTGITFDAAGGAKVLSPPPIAPAPAGSVGPRSEAPVTPAGGGLPLGGTPGTPVAENASAAPATAPDVPVQVASTDPAAGVSATVGKPTVPPVVQTPEVTRLAQAMQTAPPGVRQADFDIIQGLKKAKLDAEAAQHLRINNMDVDKDAQTKAADAAVKKYDNLSTQAQSARKLMPNLDLALALMNDPDFHSGILSGAQDTWARLKDATGIQKMANAPNETFDKLMAGTVLDTMKSTLAGLGQVRLAEIDLLNRANANRYNTDSSNRAVLEISRRAIQKVDQLDGLGQQYASGDEVVDPITGKTMLKANIVNGEIAPRRGLDVGFDKIARKFTLDHPSFTSDEIKNYQSIFTTGRPEGYQGPWQKNEVREFSDGKGGTTRGKFDGKEWKPVK